MAALKGIRAQPKNASWGKSVNAFRKKSVEMIMRSSSQLVYSTDVHKKSTDVSIKKARQSGAMLWFKRRRVYPVLLSLPNADNSRL
ncbi:MAG: hypothetical protein ABF290_02650 [Thiogranum sp.]